MQKTRTKTIQSLALGRFTAHETLLECRNAACSNNTVYAAESLARLAPPSGSFSYDVLVYVGKALFVRHRCVEEVVDELLARGVSISTSEVAWLGKRFVVCLALAHRQSAPRVKEAMYEKGGYILHLDGTYDNGGPMLISGIDSISGIVLGNEKVPSEKTGEIVPFLICWVLAGKDQADGYGFPFDRPQLELASRLLTVHQLLGQIRQAPMFGKLRRNRPLCQLFETFAPLAGDHILKKHIETIRKKTEVFDRLRDAMRMAPVGAKAGLNSGDEPETMGPIQIAVTAFRTRLAARSDCRPGSSWQKMIDQLDKYWEKLFADPIEVKIAGKLERIQPQRTNNVMERFFRDFRRAARRRSGHNRIGKFLQTMIADTPLIKNLDRPDYVKILLNGHADLETCFAQLEIEIVRRETNLAQSQDQRIPPEIKKLLDDPALPNLINSLFEKAA